MQLRQNGVYLSRIGLQLRQNRTYFRALEQIRHAVETE